MAVTNYHTINGQILSEQTAGVRTEYVHDALGSVIATTDANRNVQNTYRWAPYGTRIAKSGMSPDPDFQWLGTLGYRATGRAYAGSYVRSRHFGWEQAGWTSVDGLWPGMSAYGYSFQNPARWSDPTGFDPALGRSSPAGLQHLYAGCGQGAEMVWQFTVGDKVDGWIVQHVVLSLVAYCCDDPSTPQKFAGCAGQTCGQKSKSKGPPSAKATFEFYESFRVIGGQSMWPKSLATCVLTSGNDWGPAPDIPVGTNVYKLSDDWQFPKNGCGLNYEATITGELYWTKANPFHSCGCCFSGSLPSACTYSNPAGAMSQASGSATYTSSCCGSPSSAPGGCPGGGAGYTKNCGQLTWDSGLSKGSLPSPPGSNPC